jgi:hypothetical protein
MHTESRKSTTHQISLYRDLSANRPTSTQIKGELIVPFGATSGSSPFLKGVLDLNPFHQFVNEVFEGEVAAEANDEGTDTGGDKDVCSCRGCGGACWGCWGCCGGGIFVG